MGTWISTRAVLVARAALALTYACETPPVDTRSVTVELHEQFEEERFGLAMSNQPILFFDREGVLIAETATDDEGKARGTVSPDAILVIPVATSDDGGSKDTLAVYGVQPGDAIVFESPSRNDLGALLGTMTIDPPGPPGGYGDCEECEEVDYEFSNGCVSSGDATMNFFEGCVVDGQFDVLLRARSYGDIVAATWKHGTYVADGISSIPYWEASGSLVIPVTQVPAGLGAFFFSVAAMNGHLVYGDSGRLGAGGGSGDFDFEIDHILRSFGDRIQVTASYDPGQRNLGRQSGVYVLDPATAQLPLALREELLPWYGQPLYAESQQRLSWASTAGERTPDAIYLSLSAPLGIGGQVSWVAVVPPDRTEIVLPHLPAPYEGHMLEGYQLETQSIYAIETSDAEGYAIREAGTALFFDVIRGVPPTEDVGFVRRVSLWDEL